jgi:chromosome segregation ATPase
MREWVRVRGWGSQVQNYAAAAEEAASKWAAAEERAEAAEAERAELAARVEEALQEKEAYMSELDSLIVSHEEALKVGATEPFRFRSFGEPFDSGL